MSKYAHLSKPDPEFAAFLERYPLAVPFAPPPVDIAAAQKGWIEHGQAPYVAHEKSRLCPG